MRSLRELLATWEAWTQRVTIDKALAVAKTDHHREVMRRALADRPEIDLLEVSWEQVGTATGVTRDQARTDYVAAIEHQGRHGLVSI